MRKRKAADEKYKQDVISRYVGSGKYGQTLKMIDISWGTTYMALYVPNTLNVNGQLNALNIDRGLGNVQCINLIQAGTNINQRVGNRISLSHLRMRMNIFFNNVLSDNGNPVSMRLIIVYDRQTNNSANPLTTDQLFSRLPYGFAAANSTNLNASANVDINSLDRFTVIWDKFEMVAQYQSAPSYGPVDLACYKVDETIPLDDLETVYSASSNLQTPNDIVTGGLYLLSYSLDAQTNSSFSWMGDIRTFFHDN